MIFVQNYKKCSTITAEHLEIIDLWHGFSTRSHNF